MPIAAGDIDFHLSGGGANADPNASLGGVRSSTQLVDATLHNLFDIVSGDEAAAGDAEYRCFYVRNAHGTLTLQNAEVYIQSNTPSGDTDVAIGLDPAGVGDGSATGVAATAADESTAPAGVTFSQPASGTPLAIGNLAPGESQAIWVRRDVAAAAAAYNNDQAVIRVQGETAA